MSAAMPNLASELRTEQLVPTYWTSLIVTLPLSLWNQLPSHLCLIKISISEVKTITTVLTHMITAGNLEVSTAPQETKAQLKAIHQSSAKLHIHSNKQSKLKLLMLHVSTQRVLSSCQLNHLPQKFILTIIPNRTLPNLISPKVDGSVLSAKTTTLKEEKIAIDARKKSLMRTSKESQSTWAKPNSPRSKRKLLRLKRKQLLNKTSAVN